MAAPEWASLRRWGGNDCLGKSLSRMFTFLELQAKSAGADNLGEDANLDLRQTLQQLFIWHSTEGRRVFRLVNPANTGDEGTLFVVVHEMRAAPCSRDPNEPDEPVLLCSYVSNDWSVTNLSTAERQKAAHRFWTMCKHFSDENPMAAVRDIICTNEELDLLAKLLESNQQQGLRKVQRERLKFLGLTELKAARELRPVVIRPLYPKGGMVIMDAENLKQSIKQRPDGQYSADVVQFSHGVKTHHFFIATLSGGSGMGGMGPMMRNARGEIYIFTDREEGYAAAQKMGLTGCQVCGMGDEKWSLFQKMEKYVLVSSDSPTDEGKGEFNPQALKTQGNLLFKKGEYRRAVAVYTTAIENSTDPLLKDDSLLNALHSNRAGALLKLGDHAAALEDAECVLRINPCHGKCLYRKGQALFGLDRCEQAEEHLIGALEVLNDSETKTLLEKVRKAMAAQTDVVLSGATSASWSMTKLRQYAREHAIDVSACLEKVEFVNLVDEDLQRTKGAMVKREWLKADSERSGDFHYLQFLARSSMSFHKVELAAQQLCYFLFAGVTSDSLFLQRSRAFLRDAAPPMIDILMQRSPKGSVPRGKSVTDITSNPWGGLLTVIIADDNPAEKLKLLQGLTTAFPSVMELFYFRSITKAELGDYKGRYEDLMHAMALENGENLWLMYTLGCAAGNAVEMSSDDIRSSDWSSQHGQDPQVKLGMRWLKKFVDSVSPTHQTLALALYQLALFQSAEARQSRNYQMVQETMRKASQAEHRNGNVDSQAKQWTSMLLEQIGALEDESTLPTGPASTMHPDELQADWHESMHAQQDVVKGQVEFMKRSMEINKQVLAQQQAEQDAFKAWETIQQDKLQEKKANLQEQQQQLQSEWESLQTQKADLNAWYTNQVSAITGREQSLKTAYAEQLHRQTKACMEEYRQQMLKAEEQRQKELNGLHAMLQEKEVHVQKQVEEKVALRSQLESLFDTERQQLRAEMEKDLAQREAAMRKALEHKLHHDAQGDAGQKLKELQEEYDEFQTTMFQPVLNKERMLTGQLAELRRVALLVGRSRQECEFGDEDLVERAELGLQASQAVRTLTLKCMGNLDHRLLSGWGVSIEDISYYQECLIQNISPPDGTPINWHPTKVVVRDDGTAVEVVKEDDPELQKIRRKYNKEAADHVVAAFLDMQHYNGSGRYMTLVPWCFDEDRELTAAEILCRAVKWGSGKTHVPSKKKKKKK